MGRLSQFRQLSRRKIVNVIGPAAEDGIDGRGVGDYVSSTAYTVEGTLNTMQCGGDTETRTYYPLGRLTGIAGGPTNVNIAYSFAATTNSGRRL